VPTDFILSWVKPNRTHLVVSETGHVLPIWGWGFRPPPSPEGTRASQRPTKGLVGRQLGEPVHLKNTNNYFIATGRRLFAVYWRPFANRR